MKRVKKSFYDFNFTDDKNEAVELFMYGEITSDKWDDYDVDFQTFKDAIDSISDGGTLNIYQNCYGGECFLASSIIALMNRAKERGITINSYIDSLSASASSWISCASDNLYIYSQSILMLHKPLTVTFGNANDLKKEIELLDKLENDVMIPIYMKKVRDGVSEDDIRALIENESWLTADEIQKYFKCELIESNNLRVASVGEKYKNIYKNIPSQLLSQEETVAECTVTKDEVNAEKAEILDKKIELLRMEINLLKED